MQSGNSRKKIIATAAFTAGIAAMLAAAAFTGYSPLSSQVAVAQSGEGEQTPAQTQGIRRSLTYFVTETASVPANGNATAQAFCQNGDVLLTGGYAMGFDSPQQAFNSMLYSNTAVRIQNATSSHEGWQAGLVNMDTEPLTITANAVCLDVTPRTE
jgi:hypothetical protein